MQVYRPDKTNLTPEYFIAASAMLSMVLGTIHAFSVFMPQWEGLENADRASVSLIYSVALISLTVAVLFGHRVYWRIRPPFMFVVVGLVTASGLALSADRSSLTSLYLAYGVIFGGNNVDTHPKRLIQRDSHVS